MNKLMAMEDATLKFAAALHRSCSDFSDADRLSAMLNFIDGIACGHAGFRRVEIQTLLASKVVDVRSDELGWLIGSGLRCRPSDAVLINSMAAHIDDFDDDEALVSIAHVTVPTMTAAVAAAAISNCSGATLLNGYLSGVETMVALGHLLNPEHYALGWHASATLGVFGAAIAAGHVLGLSAEQKATALAFAATTSSGMRSAFGSSAKPWQVASAARNGFDAAQLAAIGLDANASIFGRMGLAELYGGDPSRINDVLSHVGSGSPFHKPGVTIKAYPCCTAAHTAMEACEIIRNRSPNDFIETVDSIRVTVGKTIPSILVHSRPTTALEGKFSMQFCAAAALCLPSAGLDAFTDEMLEDRNIRRVMERVHMVGLAEQDDPFLCNVTVSLIDGSSDNETVMRTKGSPDRPFNRSALQQKFAMVCGSADADTAFEYLYQLPMVPAWRPFEQRLGELLGNLKAKKTM